MTKLAGFVLLFVGASSMAVAGAAGAPEVDAGFAAGALVLIGGATLMIRARLRKH